MFKDAFQNGSMNYFGQVVQEILQKKVLKTNF